MKVLIVEDSIDFAKPLLDFFKIDGHNTEHSDNLANAEAYLKVSKFDIILLDIMLPDGDGRNLLKKIRKQNLNTPVIIMTAKSEVSDKIDLLDIGADDYITKPFDFSELDARCRAVLRRHKGNNQLCLTYNNTSLYPLLGYLNVGEKKIQLRNKELRLLEIFFNSPEMYFSKNQIADRLFSISESVSDNTIEVYIGRVRKLLKDSNAKIETNRGMGYRLTSL